MTARVDDRVEVYGTPVTCRCGCGSTIASTRTFVNKDHQVAWLRSEAAKRRRARAQAAPSPVKPETVPAPTPLAAPPSVLDVEPVAARPELDLRLLDPAPRPAPSVQPRPETAAVPAAAVSYVRRPVQPALDVQAGVAEPTTEAESLSLVGEIYVVAAVVAALPVFFGVWLFCLAAFGLPLGGGLGWLPALLVAAAAGALWPLLIVAGIVLLVLML